MSRIVLADYAADYVRLVDGSNGYLEQIGWAIRSIEKWLGRRLYVDDLTERLINDYLAAVRDTLSGQTRLSRRNMLVRLWRHAATNVGLIERPELPNRDLISRVKRRQPIPQAWSIDDVRRLYVIADGLWGYYSSKINKRMYWKAYILSAWSTGMRRCDLVQLEVADIPPSGRIAVVQQKTGRHVFGQLSAEAMAAVRELTANHGQRKVFPIWCQSQTWRKIAQRLVRRAGIRLSIGKLRASAGTDVELFRPGFGPQFLGNSPQVFYERYFDRRLGGDIPTPRPITG